MEKIIFWVLLILAALGVIPAAEPYIKYIRLVDLILIGLLGLKVFGF